MPTLPEAYDAEYAVEGLTNVSVENGTLKYNATGVKPGQYTLNVTDKSSKYVPSVSYTHLDVYKRQIMMMQRILTVQKVFYFH